MSVDTSSLAWLNGQWLPINQCAVSVLDRGFLFGDGVYEVIPVFSGIPIRQTQHFQRLAQNLSILGIDSPYRDKDWCAVIQRLIQLSPEADAAIYIQITRGNAPRDHFNSEFSYQATCFAMRMPLRPPSEKILEQGLCGVGVEDLRWHRCNIKTISMVGNVLARKEALEQGADEAILFRDGQLTETPAANVFLVQGNSLEQAELVTPPCDQWILPGITRAWIKEIAEQHAIAFQERTILREEVFAADEVWIGSSTRVILPLTVLDDQAIGRGKPGPVWQQFCRWIQADIQGLKSKQA